LPDLRQKTTDAAVARVEDPLVHEADRTCSLGRHMPVRQRFGLLRKEGQMRKTTGRAPERIRGARASRA